MFQPRPYFPFPTNLPSWFVGHMHKALGVMDQKLASMDLFVEVRDARLPLSSINPAFERLSGPEKRARRLIVYTKRDLADNRFEQVRSAQPMGHFSFNPTVQLAILNIEHIIQPLKQAFDRHNADTVLFANARNDQDARKVLKHILQLAHQSATRYDRSPSALNVMMAGMPNVGKSSLLNALRRVGVQKGKATFTGSNAGVTRKVQGVVKVWEEPDTYVTDTPGIMIPYFGRDDAAGERALSLALSGGIKDRFFSIETLGEYLLWRINHRFFGSSAASNPLPEALKKFMPPLPTNDYEEFLTAIARHIGALEKGGHPDMFRANRWLIEAFRDGRLGSWTLDDLTFTGPAYLALPDAAFAPTPRIQQPDASLALDIGTSSPPLTALEEAAAPQPVPQATSLAPLAPHELTVPAQLSFPDRVSLTVSTWLMHHHHRLLFPTRAQMSAHAIKKAEKAEEAEKRRLKMQRKGISTRPRHLSSAPVHMRTKTGKSSMAFRRANQARKRLRKAQGKSRKS